MPCPILRLSKAAALNEAMSRVTTSSSLSILCSDFGSRWKMRPSDECRHQQRLARRDNVAISFILASTSGFLDRTSCRDRKPKKYCYAVSSSVRNISSLYSSGDDPGSSGHLDEPSKRMEMFAAADEAKAAEPTSSS